MQIVPPSGCEPCGPVPAARTTSTRVTVACSKPAQRLARPKVACRQPAQRLARVKVACRQPAQRLARVKVACKQSAQRLAQGPGHAARHRQRRWADWPVPKRLASRFRHRPHGPKPCTTVCAAPVQGASAKAPLFRAYGRRAVVKRSWRSWRRGVAASPRRLVSECVLRSADRS